MPLRDLALARGAAAGAVLLLLVLPGAFVSLEAVVGALACAASIALTTSLFVVIDRSAATLPTGLARGALPWSAFTAGTFAASCNVAYALGVLHGGPEAGWLSVEAWLQGPGPLAGAEGSMLLATAALLARPEHDPFDAVWPSVWANCGGFAIILASAGGTLDVVWREPAAGVGLVIAIGVSGGVMLLIALPFSYPLRGLFRLGDRLALRRWPAPDRAWS